VYSIFGFLSVVRDCLWWRDTYIALVVKSSYCASPICSGKTAQSCRATVCLDENRLTESRRFGSFSGQHSVKTPHGICHPLNTNDHSGVEMDELTTDYCCALVPGDSSHAPQRTKATERQAHVPRDENPHTVYCTHSHIRLSVGDKK